MKLVNMISTIKNGRNHQILGENLHIHSDCGFITQSHQSQHLMIRRRLSLLKKRNSLHLRRKKLDYFHLKIFLTKHPLTPPQHRIICFVACHTNKYRLAVEIGRWSPIPSLFVKTATFAPIMRWIVRHMLCWKCCLYNPSEIRFHNFSECTPECVQPETRNFSLDQWLSMLCIQKVP